MKQPRISDIFIRFLTKILALPLMLASISSLSFAANNSTGSLDEQVLSDIGVKIASSSFSLGTCDEFEAFLRDKNGQMFETAIARINYTPEKRFEVGYKNDDKWNLPHLLVLVNYLNKLGFSSSQSFSFFFPLWDACCYPPEIASYFARVPFVFPDHLQGQDEEIILIPDIYQLADKYTEEMEEIKRSSLSQPFRSREDVVGWRGSQTGAWYNMEAFNALPPVPRLNLVMLTHTHPAHVDARFTRSYDLQLEETSEGKFTPSALEYKAKITEIFGPPASFVPFPEMTKYRYNISTDGNCSAWRRPQSIMFSGSVPIFSTRHECYFTKYLTENVHYIAVKRDMSDLIEKVEMLKANPELAESIACEASNFAETIFTADFTKRYMLTLMRQIAEKFQ